MPNRMIHKSVPYHGNMICVTKGTFRRDFSFVRKYVSINDNDNDNDSTYIEHKYRLQMTTYI